jgi:hypothetical protein
MDALKTVDPKLAVAVKTELVEVTKKRDMKK